MKRKIRILLDGLQGHRAGREVMRADHVAIELCTPDSAGNCAAEPVGWSLPQSDDGADGKESVDYSEHTVSELKELLRDRDLKVSGVKAELIQRLEASE